MGEMRSGTLDLASDIELDELSEGYDPLEFVEGEDDEDWMDDDGLLLPDALPPEVPVRHAPAVVYSPETAGSVRQALRDLVTVNASRRAILLAIVDRARDGVPSGELFRCIEELQKDNLSVYEPISYCRMLERTGALEMLRPESENDGAEGASLPDPVEEADGEDLGGVVYLSIDDPDANADPLWRATEEGLAAYDELVQGTEWREKVLGEDAKYAEVYLAVMKMMEDGVTDKKELGGKAETFEVTKRPLKLGPYFIDVLEATSAVQWRDGGWRLTELGAKLLPELEEFCEGRRPAAQESQEA